MWPVDRVTPDAFDLRIKEELLARRRERKGGGNVLEARVTAKGGSVEGGMTFDFLGKGVDDGREWDDEWGDCKGKTGCPQGGWEDGREGGTVW